MVFAKAALHVRPAMHVSDPFGVARGELDVSRVIGTEYPALRLLSNRAIHLLRREGATGWESQPVEINTRNGKTIDGYELLVITGRCGPIENSRSVKVSQPPPAGGNPHVIVTERIRDLFEREKLTNISFVRLTDVERLRL